MAARELRARVALGAIITLLLALIGALTQSPAAADPGSRVVGLVHWQSSTGAVIGTLRVSPAHWTVGEPVTLTLDYTLAKTESHDCGGSNPGRYFGGRYLEVGFSHVFETLPYTGADPPKAATNYYEGPTDHGTYAWVAPGAIWEDVQYGPRSYSVTVPAPSTDDPDAHIYATERNPSAPCGEGYQTNTYSVPVSDVGELTTSLAAFDPTGHLITGQLAPGQDIVARLTVSNQTGETVKNLTYPGGAALTVDPRSSAGVAVLGASAAPPTTLAAHQTVQVYYPMTTTQRGIAAAYTKVTGVGTTSGNAVEAHYSLKFDVEDGAVVNDAYMRLIVMQAIDSYLTQTYQDLLDSMSAKGAKLKEQLKKVLPKALFRRWFGDKGTNPTEIVQASHQGAATDLVDARLPDRGYQGYSVDELNDAYNQEMKAQLRKGVEQYIVGKAEGLGKAKSAWEKTMTALNYFTGNASPEERQYFEAAMVKVAEKEDAEYANLVKTWNGYGPGFKNKASGVAYATLMTVNSGYVKAKEFKKGLDSSYDARVAKYATSDPIRFQQECAKADAKQLNKGLSLIADTLLGGAAGKTVEVAGEIRLGGRGIGVIEEGKALGALDADGRVIQKAETAIPELAEGSGAVTGLELPGTEEFLSNLKGATVVQSTDAGSVYALPNLGGVPLKTLDTKAGILGDLEASYTKATGKQIKLAEVLKPSSELRKPGSVGKVELAKQNTGKAIMLEAGAPKQILGEASVWHAPDPPSTLPEWDAMSAPERQSAMKAWKDANESWQEWKHPTPGSETERLQSCIGRRNTVPLDAEPDGKGVQRFVTAEFETVPVTGENGAKGELIRVKHYEVEDRIGDQVVNRRTVVDSPEALPQGPDADAVAVAKVVGKNAKGEAILEPLDASERSFVMPRYIDANVKARQSGLMPDAAEHSATLVGDDLSARKAGYIVAKHGAPFLPTGAGTDYLARIAKFVAPEGTSPQDMFDTMLQWVQGAGDFGKHAVVITTDSRYLGEVDVSRW